VVTGKEFLKILEHAKKNAYAIPAVNCTMSPISNACMEAAMKANAPMIVQFSNGGGYYNVGKGIPNDKEMKAAVAGTIAGALHVRAIAEVRATTRPPPLPASRYTPPPRGPVGSCGERRWWRGAGGAEAWTRLAFNHRRSHALSTASVRSHNAPHVGDM
jgi:hypothetical protein